MFYIYTVTYNLYYDWQWLLIEIVSARTFLKNALKNIFLKLLGQNYLFSQVSAVLTAESNLSVCSIIIIKKQKHSLNLSQKVE